MTDHGSIATRQERSNTVCLMDCSHGSEQQSESSFHNQAECGIVMTLLKFYREFEPTSSIGVICGYKAQVKLIKRTFKSQYPDLYRRDLVIINTIDSFQVCPSSHTRAKKRISSSSHAYDPHPDATWGSCRISGASTWHSREPNTPSLWWEIAKQYHLSYIHKSYPQICVGRITSSIWFREIYTSTSSRMIILSSPGSSPTQVNPPTVLHPHYHDRNCSWSTH